MPDEWRLSGLYFENCNCTIICPCLFLGDPTEGECTTASAWHIERGNYGDTPLDNLNVVMVAYSPGNMWKEKWKVALYLDETANQFQTDALIQIYSGNAGGHPTVLTPFIDEVLGVKSVPIQFQAEGKRRTLILPGVLESEIEAIAAKGGAEITFGDTPLCITPGHESVVAESTRLRFQDYGMKWDTSNRYGSYSRFTYEGP